MSLWLFCCGATSVKFSFPFFNFHAEKVKLRTPYLTMELNNLQNEDSVIIFFIIQQKFSGIVQNNFIDKMYWKGFKCILRIGDWIWMSERVLKSKESHMLHFYIFSLCLSLRIHLNAHLYRMSELLIYWHLCINISVWFLSN